MKKTMMTRTEEAEWEAEAAGEVSNTREIVEETIREISNTEEAEVREEARMGSWSSMRRHSLRFERNCV